MDYDIRPLHDCKDLAPLCAAWSYAEWGCLEDGRRSLQEVVEEYGRRANNADGLPRTWLSLVEGKPAGMISLKQHDHEQVRDLTPWLASLFVHPAFRGRGIARELCLRMVREAKIRGFSRLYLYTATDRALYRELGWRPICFLPDPIGLSAEGCLLMERRI